MKLLSMVLSAGISLAAEGPSSGKVAQQTPFGVSIKEAQQTQRVRPQPRLDPALVKVEEKGDTITFRRLTPFGEQVWSRKRSELSAVEQAVIAAKTKKPAASTRGSQ